MHGTIMSMHIYVYGYMVYGYMYMCAFIHRFMCAFIHRFMCVYICMYIYITSLFSQCYACGILLL